jgi:hypothetical protein
VEKWLSKIMMHSNAFCTVKINRGLKKNSRSCLIEKKFRLAAVHLER